MTATVAQPMTHDFSSNDHAPYRPPFALRIVSLVFFAGFSIPVTIVALNIFWPAGFVLGLVIAVQWTKIMGLSEGTPLTRAVDALRPKNATPDAPQSSGNASFDAYRTELLNRLETEQQQFDTFLVRLRDAKDKSEFDSFMEDRAARVTEPREIDNA